MSALVLRAPRAEERSALLDLWVASWRTTFPAIDFDARRGWLIAHLERLEQAGAAIVAAFAGARPEGFVVVDPAGRIDQIVVAPHAQGRGVAQRLMGEARRIAPDRLELDVNADNPRALRFYDREGFQKIGEGRNPNSGLPTFKLVWTPSRPSRSQPG